MSLPSDLISDARGYATTTLSSAMRELGVAMQVLQGLGRTVGGPAFPLFPLLPPTPRTVPEPPQYAGPHYVAPPNNAVAPVLTPVTPLVLPPDVGPAPLIADYNEPGKPQGEAGDRSLLTGAPAANPGDFVVPTAPDLLAEIRGIPKPTLISITVPGAPAYREPGFTGVKPRDPLAPPSGIETMIRAQFESSSSIMRTAATQQLDSFLDREFPNFRAGMAAIEARLATYLAGGSALSVATENALYNRTLDKTNADAIRATKKNYGAAARAGMTLHTAALASMQKDIDQSRRDNNARAAIDIAVKQAELEQNNLQFAVTQSANLRQTAISAALSYYNGLVTINGHAIEYARATVDAIVKAYDLSMKFSEIQARIYEAEGRIYEAKVRGALGEIEAYQALVRGLEAQSNVNLAQVQAYKAQLEAVTSEAAVYRAQVEAVTARAGVEKMLVEVYQAKVQAYGAQINARSAEWQGYEAANRGQQAKVTASAERVRGYAAQVEARRATIQGLTAQIEAQLKTNEGLVKVYETQLSAFHTLVQGQSASVAAEVGSFSETLKGYQAKQTADSEHERAMIAHFEAALRAAMSQAQVTLEQLREDHALTLARVKGITEVSVTAGQIYGNQAAAALSGMNSLAVATIEATA